MAGLKGKKILVTGGTGFIGSNLVSKLLLMDAEVIVSDIALQPHSLFIVNRLHQKAKLIISDVRIKKDVISLFEDNKPDYVIHLAAQAVVETAYKSPVETLETNINGTINVLETARFMPSIKSIIVASTDKAYGKTEKTYSENFPLRGDHPYDVSKSAADLICQTYFKTYKTPVVITRFGNVYGEGDLHFDRIVPGICKSIIRNQTLEIRSDGKYVRDYLYVDDVVNGYIFLLNQNSKVHGEAFNFSSGDKLSVLELIEKANKVTKSKIDYVILNSAKNEIPYQHLNDKKIKKLGWRNNYRFDTIFQEVLNWYRKII